MNLAVLALLVSAVVSGRDGCPSGNPYVVWTGSTPPVEQQMAAGHLGLAPNGRVLGTRLGNDDRRIWELRPDAAPVPVATLAHYPDRLTVARDGTIYVFNTPVITGRYLSAVRDGSTIRQFNMALADTAPDLAADQCTLFYVHGGGDRIRRLNVCTGEQLPDFATGLPLTRNLRILPDGGVLAAHQGNYFINYAPDGTVRRRYDAPGHVGWDMPLAISGNQRSFWTVTDSCTAGARLVEFDLDNGAILTQQPVPRIAEAFSLVLTDGWTAALGFGGGSVGVPSLSVIGAAVFVAFLAAFAVIRLR